jgi:hypothetical protein
MKQLPIELFQDILSYLTLKNLINIKSINKLFNSNINKVLELNMKNIFKKILKLYSFLNNKCVLNTYMFLNRSSLLSIFPIISIYTTENPADITSYLLSENYEIIKEDRRVILRYKNKIQMIIIYKYSYLEELYLTSDMNHFSNKKTNRILGSIFNGKDIKIIYAKEHE